MKFHANGYEEVEFHADYSIEDLKLILQCVRDRADDSLERDEGKHFRFIKKCDAETLDRLATKLEGDLDDNETELMEAEA
tara:strand:- start:637 stop:876 length:240 start_codon:yes stop_codon:yes gene_type:complete